MLKGKIGTFWDYLIKNSKIAFPIILISAVAITVSVALGMSGNRKIQDILPEETVPVPEVVVEAEDVPLIANEDAAIDTLVRKFYVAQAAGDLDTLVSLCDEISDLDLLSFQEKANYIDDYPVLEIYTKKGFHEGETIAYVYYRMTFVNHEEEFPGYTSHYICTAEDGSLFMKRNNFTDEMNEYSIKVCSQDDVVEFNNRVKVEYDNFVAEHPELAAYPQEVMDQVNVTVGVKWAEMQAAMAEPDDEPEGGETQGGQSQVTTEDDGPLYATANATVNVRSSDSQQADKLGKVTAGSRIQVLEQRVNGWSKVLFEKKEGYIKSEFLDMEESAAGLESVGTVVATSNINVRASASQTATKLGVLTGGDSAELLGMEDDWCKIKYNGKVAYVKAEYVEKQ